AAAPRRWHEPRANHGIPVCAREVLEARHADHAALASVVGFAFIASVTAIVSLTCGAYHKGKSRSGSIVAQCGLQILMHCLGSASVAGEVAPDLLILTDI